MSGQFNSGGPNPATVADLHAKIESPPALKMEMLQEVLEKHPDLEKFVREEFCKILIQIQDQRSPLPELQDYFLESGVKNK